MATEQFSPQFEVILESTGGNEFSVIIGPHTANNLGGGTAFLAVPEMIDDTDPVYFYFGWSSINSGWLVRRQVRLTSLTTNATEINNVLILDLANAWSSRDILTYI